MKRIVTLLLVAGLVLGVAIGSQAADFKISGMWQHRLSWANRDFNKESTDDIFRSSSRMRTQIDVIASETLKGVFFFEIGHQNWGRAAQGASLGTDGTVIKVRYSYVDWVIPQTEVKIRVGLQKYMPPTFTGIGSPILDADGAGITVSNQFTPNVGTTLFWLRAANDNDPERSTVKSHNAMDFAGITVPLTFDGAKVTPWGMYGFIGQDSFKGTGAGMDDLGYARLGMLPLMGTAAIAGNSDKTHGNAWYAGVAAEMTLLDPFRIALDAAYGSVDLGTSMLNAKNFEVKRSGWYAALTADYKMDFGTPGMTFWYSSGDDANAYNGSERLPSIDPDLYPTSYGYDGTQYGGAAQVLGFGLAGTWAAMARIKDISFVEDLSHIVRVVYYRGTNNTEMVHNQSIRNPQMPITIGDAIYLTTADSAVEVNIDTEYKVYKDLSLFLELGYIRLDLDKTLWKGVGYEANKNNLKGAVSLRYLF